MAKNSNTETEAPAETATTKTPAAEPDKRIKLVTVPASPTHPYTEESFKEALTGETKQMPRAEFIREYALTNNYDRSQLTAFTRLAAGDSSIKYQIIFQATKSVSDKVKWPEKAKPVAETPATEGEAASGSAGE